MTTNSDPLRRANLARLFAPASVAVVGASATPGKVGYHALLSLAEFPGEVFPINPNTKEILNRRAFASLRAVGHPVDLVIFAVPAAACVEAVSEAIACGCGAGLVLGSGFAETGPVGKALQNQLENLVASSAFRLLGPNTAGFLNRHVPLTASFVAGADSVPAGNVAVVAQSAGVNFTVGFLLEKLGTGVSVAVGLGNAIDVDAASVLEFLADHEPTKAIALHLEGEPHGRRLYDVLCRVTLQKPVVALTVGREEVGEFARSHTGNMIGSYELRRTALRQAGAVVVATTDDLAAAATVLSLHRLPAKRRPGVGVLTAQGGAGLLMLDQLKSHDVSVPELSEPTMARVNQQLPPITFLKNPVDTGRPGASFPAVVQAVADDAGVDLVVAYALHEPAGTLPEVVLPPIAHAIDKPLLFGTMGPSQELPATIQALRKEGLYVAESPEQLAHAAIVLVRDAEQQERLKRPWQQAARLPDVDLPEHTDEHAAKSLLDASGVPTPRRFVASSHAEALDALRRLGAPVAAKILSAEITHKTEAGGVHLDIEDEAGLRAALARLDCVPVRSNRRYLIEAMAPPGLELIVGATRDASFGPTVTVGLGGTLTEVLKDTVTRLAPLTASQAEEMLDELRAARVFHGFRGGPRLDRRAVANVVATLGWVLCRHESVAALEVNPLRVYEHGVLALDAVLIRSASA